MVDGMNILRVRQFKKIKIISLILFGSISKCVEPFFFCNFNRNIKFNELLKIEMEKWYHWLCGHASAIIQQKQIIIKYCPINTIIRSYRGVHFYKT